MTATPFLRALALLLPAALSLVAGELPARVTDPQGRSVAGAQVRIQQWSRTQPVPLVGSQGAISDNQGRVRFADLIGGSWLVCVTVPESTLLDPCEWSTNPPLVTVPSTGAAPEVVVQLEEGGRLELDVDDPDEITNPAALTFVPQPVLPPGSTAATVIKTDTRQAAAPTTVLRPALFQPQLRKAPGVFSPVRLAGRQNKKARYQITVPLNREVETQFWAVGVVVEDDKGAKVDPTKPDKWKPSAADKQKTLKYTVRKESKQ